MVISFLFAFSSLLGAAPRDRIIDDLISDVIDLKHKIHVYEIEKGLLEEKVNQQESQIQAFQKQLKSYQSEEMSKGKIAILEKKIASLESETTQKLNIVDQHIANTKKALESLLKFSQKEEVAATGIYKVKSGDSLEKIAKAHQMSVDTLKKLNGLEKDRIYAGQELKISSPP